MKKSIIFLINGLGIEKPESYSISLEQVMPKMTRVGETSYYSSAIINSVEYRSGYEQFFLGDTSNLELEYIHNDILNSNINSNNSFLGLANVLKSNSSSKLHIFIEAKSSKVVDEINNLITNLNVKNNIYLHLLLTEQTVSEYNQIIEVVNYIKYHIDTRASIGFVMGSETYPAQMDKNQIDTLKKLFFLCSAERWTETEKKLETLRDEKINPCMAPAFCVTNDCVISNGDSILFFNAKGLNYDKYLNVIFDNAQFYYKTDKINIYLFSLAKFDSKYNINYMASSINYENSLANIMNKSGKNCLILTDKNNISLINFYVNGFSNTSNNHVQFMDINNDYFNNKDNLRKVIEESGYDLFIFDYHMDVSKTILDLKEQLGGIDNIIGMLGEICENKHSLFITSLYGLKKEMPIAPYNPDPVLIDYELQIPIFFYDYTYPRSKYTFTPLCTNDILKTAISCIWENSELDSSIKLKGLLNNLLGKK